MKRTTGFLFDERCFWHSTGLHATTLPVGGWVQPPSGAGHAESPETKRRMKNLMDVSGLSRQLTLLSAEPATEEDLLRIHPAHYLQRFKPVSYTHLDVYKRQEQEIVNMVREGASNKRIALKLGISLSTVKTHMRNIFAKTDVVNRTELVAGGFLAHG